MSISDASIFAVCSPVNLTSPPGGRGGAGHIFSSAAKSSHGKHNQGDAGPALDPGHPNALCPAICVAMKSQLCASDAALAWTLPRILPQLFIQFFSGLIREVPIIYLSLTPRPTLMVLHPYHFWWFQWFLGSRAIKSLLLLFYHWNQHRRGWNQSKNLGSTSPPVIEQEAGTNGTKETLALVPPLPGQKSPKSGLFYVWNQWNQWNQANI
jgi:hypothetical protein